MDFIELKVLDVVDILLVAMLMFYIYRSTKGSNAPAILLGIFIVYIIWLVVRLFNMALLTLVLGQIIGVGAIALIVLFQPEIRRFLQHLGEKGRESRDTVFGKIKDSDAVGRSQEAMNIIATACGEMSEEGTGALIVIKNQNNLYYTVASGVEIDAKVSVELLKNIFFKNSPLHDGAVVVDGNKIVCAKCILPISKNQHPQSYGMRHRAGVGLSEVCDATIVVVSEQTGVISVFEGGKTIGSELTTKQLSDILEVNI